jgi:hypothetical protein
MIGCEESQVVCKAFRDRGHEAYSCDLIDTRGNKDWHIKGDIMDNLKGWDLIIMHPSCTEMAVSGNRWYGRGMKYHQKRLDAVAWTVKLWFAAIKECDKVVMENPVSVLWSYIPVTQYIQPWQFGHGETKKTGLKLHGLPKLVPTKIVDGREQNVWKMAPGPNRKRDRSVTFDGIAEGMASQWG